jgi:hypothetical protein
MPTFPTQGFANPPVINAWSWNSIGIGMSQTGVAPTSTAAILTQNLAWYVPFEIHDVPWVAKRMFVYNGATGTGNIDLGIYDSQGNRLVSFGSVAKVASAAIQYVDITDTTLQPGLYFMAFASNSATDTFAQRQPSLQQLRALNVRQQTSAFALPNPAVFAVPTIAILPEFGVSSRTF